MRILKPLLTVVLTNILLAGGCLTYGNYWNSILNGGANDSFALDNDGVFDLFQDDFGTGAAYDDRFVSPDDSNPSDDNNAVDTDNR